MEKVRYEIDPHNRLVAEGRGLEKFRAVLDGKFKVGEDNELSYHVKKSSGIDVPQEIKFSGDWSIDQDHNLVFTLDKWNNQAEGNKLVLQGELVDAGNNGLVYSVATRDGADNERIYMMKFGGAWQADEHNRLTFKLDRQTGAKDTLTLQGAWDINKHNELVYTRRQAADLITFRGHWDIADKDRLTYVLNKDIGSQFDFRVDFEKALKDGLRFSLGIGAAPLKRRMTLHGRWKIAKGLGLAFDAAHSNGKFRSINVAATYPLSKNQGEAFLKALASDKEVAIVGGVGFRW